MCIIDCDFNDFIYQYFSLIRFDGVKMSYHRQVQDPCKNMFAIEKCRKYSHENPEKQSVCDERCR